MTQTARVYRIEGLIRQHGCVSFARLLQVLEVSPATLKRDLAYLRDRLGAPIEYDAQDNGYRLGRSARGERHELPGLWFSERELYSLLTAQQLLAELDGEGALSRHLQPLLERIEQMLGASGHGPEAWRERVRIVHVARRAADSAAFEKVAEALLRRQRLHVGYQSRSRGGALSERELSPQRLVHHRNTWYLDAWCHQREALLRFALDAMQSPQLLPAKAKPMAAADVARRMDAGYGAFAGAKPRWATLQFEPEAAAWVSKEEWHPQQKAHWLADGRYQLKLPFVDATELAMDLMRHGALVEVLSPQDLRERVAQGHARAAARYA
jgi:predicted DNA-binding transcriptional regulator YafY